MLNEWIKTNNNEFLIDITIDEAKSLDLLEKLKEDKQKWLQKHTTLLVPE